MTPCRPQPTTPAPSSWGKLSADAPARPVPGVGPPRVGLLGGHSRNIKLLLLLLVLFKGVVFGSSGDLNEAGKGVTGHRSQLHRVFWGDFGEFCVKP